MNTSYSSELKLNLIVDIIQTYQISSRLPQLRLLDFRKVKLKEREEVTAFFKSKKGKEVLKEIQKKARLSIANSTEAASKPKVQANSADIQKIRDAISKASSLQEVERLTNMLQTGQIGSEFMTSVEEDEPMN